MDKQALLQQIHDEAFNDEIQKIAAETSENVMTGLGAASTVANTAGNLARRSPAMAAATLAAGAAPYAIGRMVGAKTKTEMKKQDKTGWAANAFLPFVAPYRLGRRHATKSQGYAKEVK